MGFVACTLLPAARCRRFPQSLLRCFSLRAARQLGVERPVTIRTTFLGAHALPIEAKGDKTAYIQSIVQTMLPEIAKENLADAVDAFCEGIAFSPEEVTQVFEAAAALPRHAHLAQLHAARRQILRRGQQMRRLGAPPQGDHRWVLHQDQQVLIEHPTAPRRSGALLERPRDIVGGQAEVEDIQLHNNSKG